jgi:hypothetical protein
LKEDEMARLEAIKAEQRAAAKAEAESKVPITKKMFIAGSGFVVLAMPTAIFLFLLWTFWFLETNEEVI